MKNQKQKGIILVSTLVYASIAIILIVGLVSFFAILFKATNNVVDRERAFHIAEAGTEYYKWHLAHSPNDYKDGTAENGPYIHDYFDKDGTLIGKYELEITPPQTGSTIVTIESTGYLISKPDLKRKIKIRLAIPSLAKYAFVTDGDVRFGEGTEVWGPIHSNGGVRFDGVAHNVITSARATYDDADHTGDLEFGVHTHVAPTDPLPPNSTPDRPDVFTSGREFPVPAVDFNGLITDLAGDKTLAEQNGIYYPSSGEQGYEIILKTNDTYDLYKVTQLEAPASSCTNSSNQTGWGTWSVKQKQLVGNYAFPSNGIIFVEDNVWVSGKINTARLAIVAAKFPDTQINRKSITVNNDLLYTNYDGQDVISLVAQYNINVGLVSESDLRIDSALVAVGGRAGRYYYSSNCAPYHVMDDLTLYGMIASKTRYGFSYTNNTGYQNRNIIYDPNLLYSPPPMFPLTSDYYEIISWEEVED